MDTRAILGFALIAAALVMGTLALTADIAARSRFLSLPKRRGDWVRLSLAALAAYVIGIQLYTYLGYTFPSPGSLHPDAVRVYPAAALSSEAYGRFTRNVG